MKNKNVRRAGVPALLLAALLGGASGALLGSCGPFTDFTDAVFCPFVLESFYLGITTGTTPTTFDPASNVNRLQMAAFLARTVDGVLKRGSRRAALAQAWNTSAAAAVQTVTVGTFPNFVRSDGADLWVSNLGNHTVSRVRASDGRLLETWTGALDASGVLSAMGKVFVTGFTTPGALYEIDPTQAAGGVATVAILGGSSDGIAFDGARIWTANGQGSVSIVTPTASLPWTVTTVSLFGLGPAGALFDGSNIWVTDANNGRLYKLDANGSVIANIAIPVASFPAFDGANIWVPGQANNIVAVVRASTGAVLTTLTGNGLAGPLGAAFDGQRILVTNHNPPSVSLWKAADLSQLGNFPMPPGSGPLNACSDGINFWVTLETANQLARF